jgi:hypothetical protein
MKGLAEYGFSNLPWKQQQSIAKKFQGRYGATILMICFLNFNNECLQKQTVFRHKQGGKSAA